jgi:hypothetical protein
MIKLDRDSELIWQSALAQHHDLDVLESGEIYVLTRKTRGPEGSAVTDPVIEDFVTVLESDGTPRENISLLAAFERSERYSHHWRNARKKRGDVFHTNTLEVLDGSVADGMPEFAEGNVLTSMLMLSTIAVVDLEKAEVVWAYSGDFIGQHDPQLLENGRLLVFDNGGGNPASGTSRVLEFEVPGMRIAWSYEGTVEQPLFTRTCGAAQRLPNGNTLITETDNGRAIEVTREGRIVWEFVSPHRAGSREELVASLFEMRRIPVGDVAWLPG